MRLTQKLLPLLLLSLALPAAAAGYQYRIPVKGLTIAASASGGASGGAASGGDVETFDPDYDMAYVAQPDEPAAPPAYPDTCPLTLEFVPGSYGSDHWSLMNRTALTFTVTKAVAYHPGIPAIISEGGADSFPELSNLDFSGNATAATNERLWRIDGLTNTNVSIGPNQGMYPSFYYGGQEANQKMAVYLQESNLWCAIGVRNKTETWNKADATTYKFTVQGAAWSSPSALRGAWN